MPSPKVIFVGSHIGYPMESTPLGGGAMVGLQLVRRWARREGLDLTVLGSGPLPPAPGVEYHRLPGGKEDLVHLSEFAYADFCRRFERATTDFLADQRGRLSPPETCVIVNDISEGPDVARIAGLGYRVMSIWHVDVVDYFNKLYLKSLLPPERVTAMFEVARGPVTGWLVPDILRLVFEKQRATVLCSDRLVLPSRMMAETVRRCYAHLDGRAETLSKRSIVVPWGGWAEECDEAKVRSLEKRLRAHYQLGPETRVVMTLSRLSPEKGIDLLMEALRRMEASPDGPARDVALFICGEHSFMRGASYDRRLRALAGRMKKVRVFFPGYLPALEKAAYFRLADLFVSPSIHESYGLTIVEALRAGLPVLASDHYGVEEILSPAYGRLVPYGSTADIPAAMAGELSRLLRDRAGLREMGCRAREASSRLSFEAAAERIIGEALGLARAEEAV